MAKCPNCDRTIRWDVAECPACSASFGAGSAWHPMPESTEELEQLKRRYPAMDWSKKPASVGRVALANLSLGIAFGLAALFSPFGRILSLYLDRPLLQSLGPLKAHLLNVFANYWLLATVIYVVLRVARVERFLVPARGPLLMMGLANVLLILYVAARVFASIIEGGGASFVVASFAIFIVLPSWLLIAGSLIWLLAASARSRNDRPPWRRFTTAEALVIAAFVLIPAYASWQSLHGKDGPLRLAGEALALFEEKCRGAGERVMRTINEEVRSIYLEPDGAPYYQGIINGVYSAHGGSIVGEPLVNTGWLLFIERKSWQRKPGAETSAPYTRHYLRDASGQRAYELESRFGVFSKELVAADVQKKLGVRGRQIRIVDLKSNEEIASTTFFVSERHRRFCGHAPTGMFNAGLFIQRALNLKQQYPAIDPVKPLTPR